MSFSFRVLILVSALTLASLHGLAQEVAPAATRTIVLVRHGHYVSDAADSNPGPGLSPLGVAQAKLVAARLAGLPGAFDALYASPMTRASETAKVISTELTLPIQTLPALTECTPRTRRSEIIEKEPAEKMAACAAGLDAVFRERFVPARGSERRELFVCHGNVIRYLITKALGVDTQAWLEMSVGHASMTTILVEADGRFKVIAAGDLGHVPPNLQTGSTGMSDRSLTLPK
jgi:serine/threonine-protein phosphatase PGAM5